jgi:Ion channel
MPKVWLPTGATRYRDLTLGLISVLLLPPFLRPVFPHAGLLALVVFLVLVTRILLAASSSRVFRAVLATAVLAVAIRALGLAGFHWLESGPLALSMRTMTALGFTLVAIALLQRVLEAGPVDAEKLFAAVSAYLVIGLAFASVYEALAGWHPDAFTYTGDSGQDREALFYFSLVTLSTVGYGDIVPSTPEARVLAVFEAIAGQLYLAILMGRLVGLHLNRSNTALEFGPTPKKSEEKPPSGGTEAP